MIIPYALTLAEKLILSIKSGSLEPLTTDADLVGEFTVTAYTANDPGMDGRGITATGTKATYGRTIAVDPKLIPYGSKVYIPALKDWPNGGWFVAEDTGGAIKGYKLDIFIPDRSEALRFGKKKLIAYVYKPKSNKVSQLDLLLLPGYLGSLYQTEHSANVIKNVVPYVSQNFGDIIQSVGPFKGYENYECVYTTMQQFHVLSSYNDIIDNQVVASARDIVTNVSVIYTLGSSPKTAPLVRADYTIRSDMQKTEIVDSGTVQDMLGPDGIYSWFGIEPGEDIALAYGRNYLAEKMRDMYRGELITRGIPGIKPYDMIMLNDTTNHMYGLCEVGRVVYMFSGETGFVTSIKPDLITTVEGKANMLASIITRGFGAGLFLYWNRARIMQTLSTMVGAFKTARAALLTAKAASVAQSAVSVVKGIASAVKAVGMSTLAPLVATYAITGLINKALRSVCTFFENLNTIKIFPLFIKNKYFVAGITGGKNIIGYDNSNVPPGVTIGEPGQQSITASGGILQFGPPSDRVGVITSKFGAIRKTASGGTRTHKGVDIAFNQSTSPAPIRAVLSGTVTKVAYDADGYGHYVIINHGDNIETLYAHMSTVKVRKGQIVDKGQIIGYQGSTGNSTGPHLHLELRINGKHVDPLPYLPPSCYRS